MLQAVGTVSHSDRFDGRSESAKECAVKNNELLDVILAKMDKDILLGNLNQMQSVSVLGLYLIAKESWMKLVHTRIKKIYHI